MAKHIIDPLGQVADQINQEVFDIQALVDVVQSALLFYNEEVISPAEFFAETRTLDMASKKLGALADRLDKMNLEFKTVGVSDEA